MLRYAVIFFVIALISALFGFTGIAANAQGIAKILFVGFLILAVLSFAFGRRSAIWNAMKHNFKTEKHAMDTRQKAVKSTSKPIVEYGVNLLSKIRIGLETNTRAKAVTELNLSIANASVLNV